MADKETKGAAAESPAKPDLEQQVEEWFFNHFHQQVVLNHPDVFERCTAARDDLLKLLRANA